MKCIVNNGNNSKCNYVGNRVQPLLWDVLLPCWSTESAWQTHVYREYGFWYIYYYYDWSVQFEKEKINMNGIWTGIVVPVKLMFHYYIWLNCSGRKFRIPTIVILSLRCIIVLNEIFKLLRHSESISWLFGSFVSTPWSRESYTCSYTYSVKTSDIDPVINKLDNINDLIFDVRYYKAW